MANSVPLLDLSSDPKTLERGSEKWNAMSRRVCEALETHGYITVEYCSKISKAEQEKMFKAMLSLFALPLETRTKPRPLNFNILRMDETGTFVEYETIGVHNAAQPAVAKAFTDAMWPQGNQQFCETLNTTSKKVLELAKTVINMICDAFELELDAKSPVLTEEAGLQMIRYAAPMNDGPATAEGHVDGNLVTILFQNEVEGLLVMPRQGEWQEMKLGGGSLIVLAGQSLTAWSNGKFYAVPHKVELTGYKDRLCFGLFLTPKSDQIIDAHPKFINEQCPRLFKPIIFEDLFKYLVENKFAIDGLDSYARVDGKGIEA